MDKQAFFMDLLAELYGQFSVRLHLLNSYGTEEEAPLYQMYHVELSTGQSWVLSAYHDAFASWPTFSWSTQEPLITWLRLRVALLSHLAQQHYPAPRVVLDKMGWGVARYQQWNILVTTYIEGQANLLTEENTSLLANALGHLHTLSAHPPQFLGLSWWNTTYSLPNAIHQLDLVSSFVPSAYQGLYSDIQRTLRVIQQQLNTLPEIIIHGDCWPPNGVRIEDDQVILIDWECGGRGAAILDLGALLLKCQCDQQGSFPISVDESRIAAAVHGYVQWRYPTPHELDLLLEAILFCICWRGAWLFALTLKEGWTPRVERLFQRIQHAFLLAEPTANCAYRSFKQGQRQSQPDE